MRDRFFIVMMALMTASFVACAGSGASDPSDDGMGNGDDGISLFGHGSDGDDSGIQLVLDEDGYDDDVKASDDASDNTGSAAAPDTAGRSSFWDSDNDETTSEGEDVRAVKLAPCTFGEGRIGEPFGPVTCHARYGDEANYAWSIVGDLPPGLTSAHDGNKFTVSGTPAVIGDFSITIKVASAGTHDEITLGTTVKDRLSIKISILNSSGQIRDVPTPSAANGVVTLSDLNVEHGSKIALELTGLAESYAWSGGDSALKVEVDQDDIMKCNLSVNWDADGDIASGEQDPQFPAEFGEATITVDDGNGNALSIVFVDLHFEEDACLSPPDFRMVKEDGDGTLASTNPDTSLSVDGAYLLVFPFNSHETTSSGDRVYKFEAMNTRGTVTWEITNPGNTNSTDESVIRPLRNGELKNTITSSFCKFNDAGVLKCSRISNPMDMKDTYKDDRIVEHFVVTMTDTDDTCGVRNATKQIAADIYPEFDTIYVKDIRAHAMMRPMKKAINDANAAFFSVYITGDSDEVFRASAELHSKSQHGSHDAELSWRLDDPEEDQYDEEMLIEDIDHIWLELDQSCRDCNRLRDNKNLDFRLSKVFIFDKDGYWFAVYDRMKFTHARLPMDRNNALKETDTFCVNEPRAADGKRHWTAQYGVTDILVGAEKEDPDATRDQTDACARYEPLPIIQETAWHRVPTPGNMESFLIHAMAYLDSKLDERYIDKSKEEEEGE